MLIINYNTPSPIPTLATPSQSPREWGEGEGGGEGGGRVVL